MAQPAAQQSAQKQAEPPRHAGRPTGSFQQAGRPRIGLLTGEPRWETPAFPGVRV